ncbi:MAG: hypothetical protein GY801_47020 [bacterium]|nr:hypothetical protein [bacterium]
MSCRELFQIKTIESVHQPGSSTHYADTPSVIAFFDCSCDGTDEKMVDIQRKTTEDLSGDNNEESKKKRVALMVFWTRSE